MKPSEQPSRAGAHALSVLEKVLGEQPKLNGHDFSEALRCLSEFRTGCIERLRRSASDELRRQVAQLNSIISVVYGCQYSLGGPEWEQLEKAVELYRHVLAEVPLATT